MGLQGVGRAAFAHPLGHVDLDAQFMAAIDKDLENVDAPIAKTAVDTVETVVAQAAAHRAVAGKARAHRMGEIGPKRAADAPVQRLDVAILELLDLLQDAVEAFGAPHPDVAHAVAVDDHPLAFRLAHAAASRSTSPGARRISLM